MIYQVNEPTTPNDCIFLKRVSNQIVVNTTTATKVLFDAQEFALGTKLTYDASNRGIKVASDKVAYIEVSLQLWIERAEGAYTQVYIYRNTDVISRNIIPATLSGQERWQSVFCHSIVSVSKDDRIYGYVLFSNSHATQNLVGGNYENSCLLSAKIVALR